MITQPTSSRLLQAVRDTLDELIRPALAERPQLDALDMIDSILHNVAVRSDFEYAWMVEEINDIVAAATVLTETGQDPEGDIGRALRQIPSGPDQPLPLEQPLPLDRRLPLEQPLPLDQIRDVYAEASSLLSTCLRVAGPISPDSPLDRSLRLRLAHEGEIRGPNFHMAGRG